MVIQKWTFGLLLLLCIGLMGVVRAQPNPLDELPRASLSELFTQSQSHIAEHPESLTISPGFLIEVLWRMTDAPTDAIPQGLQSFLENLADTRDYAHGVRCAALQALRRFNTPQNHDRMLGFLNSERCFRLSAAKALVQWGYWDEGSPTLIFENEFKFLVDADSARARPVLDVALYSASPYGQVLAAGLFWRYGDTTAYATTTRRILAEYLGEMKSYPDSMDLARACRTSAELAIRRGDGSVVPWLANGMLHPTSAHLRNLCVSQLAEFAHGGDANAKASLEEGARSNPYDDTRERCVVHLNRLNRKN